MMKIRTNLKPLVAAILLCTVSGVHAGNTPAEVKVVPLTPSQIDQHPEVVIADATVRASEHYAATMSARTELLSQIRTQYDECYRVEDKVCLMDLLSQSTQLNSSTVSAYETLMKDYQDIGEKVTAHSEELGNMLDKRLERTSKDIDKLVLDFEEIGKLEELSASRKITQEQQSHIRLAVLERNFWKYNIFF